MFVPTHNFDLLIAVKFQRSEKRGKVLTAAEVSEIEKRVADAHLEQVKLEPSCFYFVWHVVCHEGSLTQLFSWAFFMMSGRMLSDEAICI